MCELLWSDPQPSLGRSPSKRGVGIQFGPDVTENFIKRNKLDYVIRSHEVKPEGYEVAHGRHCTLLILQFVKAGNLNYTTLSHITSIFFQTVNASPYSQPPITGE